MAAQAHARDQEPGPPSPTTTTSAVELSNNPQQTHEKLLLLKSRNRDLCLRLIEAEEELSQLRSRRKEDAKANARTLVPPRSPASAPAARSSEKSEAELRDGVDELRREVADRDEMLNFVSRRAAEFEDSSGGGSEWCSEAAAVGFGDFRVSEGMGDPVAEECFLEREGHSVDEMSDLYGQSNGFGPEFLNSASKFWAERANLWQDVQYESLESLCQMKHFVARRESPWKVDGESTGVSSKLKLLEQELLNLERIGKSDPSKVPSKMRKQAKRYQALAGKIDDLCRRMQASDPCEPTLSSEFRTQRQTEFLLEAFRLQQRAAETRQKLTALQTKTGKGYFGDELETQAKLTMRRCLDSIKNNFKEIQRNLEIWLARIIGDLEGILARDGASRVRDYYVSRYPFVQ
ncbi:ribonuclease P protein subunit P38-like protein [Actinidia rufa]|uniref:Ribonuclease P protein subunit P38-like protein n=1 Tax=Actinidia rufa TaxID=165716 RepID=A0A7J0H010_9ERIC|nr:ribonuclease P protein subunit P38-like protein [Actinidia rufa]